MRKERPRGAKWPDGFSKHGLSRTNRRRGKKSVAARHAARRKLLKEKEARVLARRAAREAVTVA